MQFFILILQIGCRCGLRAQVTSGRTGRIACNSTGTISLITMSSKSYSALDGCGGASQSHTARGPQLVSSKKFLIDDRYAGSRTRALAVFDRMLSRFAIARALAAFDRPLAVSDRTLAVFDRMLAIFDSHSLVTAVT